MQNSEKWKENIKKEEQNNKSVPFKRWAHILREKDERTVRRRLAAYVDFLLCTVISFLLGGLELFFGTFPLAAVMALSSGKRLLPAALGLVLALMLKELPGVYGLVCLVILLLRILAVLVPAIVRSFSAGKESTDVILYAPDLPIEDGQVRKSSVGESRSDENLLSVLGGIFCESVPVRLLCGALGGFFCGLLLLLEQDFSMYSLFATLALTIGVPLLTLGLLGYFGEESYRRGGYEAVSLGLLALLCVLSASDRSLLGMPMAPFLAMLLTLYISSEKGVFGGIGVALLCGVSFSPLYIPLLLLTAVLYTLVSGVKRNAGLAAVCGLIVIFCYYIGGEQGLVYVLPPMLLAIPIYMAADKYREMMRAPYRRPAELAGGLYFAEAVAEQSKNATAKDRLASLSEAFSSLSENFYKLSDRFRRPDILGLKKITDEAFEHACEGCRNHDLCWGTSYAETLGAVSEVTAALHKKGSISETALPEGIRENCIRRDKLIEQINEALQSATQKTIRAGKADFFASNYDDITAILDAALDSDPEEYICDGEAGEKIFDYLYSCGLNVGGVAVYGKRCRHIVARKVTGSEAVDGEKSREISREIGRITEEELTEPIFEVGKDGVSMMLYSRPKVKAFCAHGRMLGEEGAELREEQIPVDPFQEAEEALCGDMTEAFITDNSYFYALISDGMGSGSEAAYTAHVSAMFIEKMLSVGNRADVTLRMLNNVIRSENMGCGSECSATVDLFELDLMSGTAAFIKSGAAPTYIAREGTVYKISARTMPIGIIKDADARITKFDTKSGDLIVMISDGCCPDSDDCPWLVEYLCGYMAKGKRPSAQEEELCRRIKEDILREAVRNSPPDKSRDDISVCVTIVG